MTTLPDSSSARNSAPQAAADIGPDSGFVTPQPLALFLAFSQMALSGFGGVLPFAYRYLVERRRWLSAAEFAEMLALGQVLPGPTICNVSVMIGWRFAGLSGACAALAGMLVAPILIVMTLGIAYQHFGDVPQVHAALAGMSAVAAGLILSTALKMGIALFRGQQRSMTRTLLMAGFVLAAFVGVGLLKWPLIAVVGILAPLTVAIAYWSES